MADSPQEPAEDEAQDQARLKRHQEVKEVEAAEAG